MNKHNCQRCRLTRLTVTQTVGEITHQRNHAILTLNRDLRNYRAAEAKQTQNTIFFLKERVPRSTEAKTQARRLEVG